MPVEIPKVLSVNQVLDCLFDGGMPEAIEWLARNQKIIGSSITQTEKRNSHSSFNLMNYFLP